MPCMFWLDVRFLSNSKSVEIVPEGLRLLGNRFRRLDPRFVEVVLRLRLVSGRYRGLLFFLLVR